MKTKTSAEEKKASKRTQNNKSTPLEEQQLHYLFMQAPLPIGILQGRNHVYKFSNPLTNKVLNVEDPVGKSIKELFPDNKEIIKLLNNTYKTGKPFTAYEYPINIEGPRKEKQTIYVNATYQPLRDENNKVIGIMTTGIDVTMQVLARQKIQESEEKFRTLAEAIPHIVYIANAKGNAEYYNQHWYEYTGLPKDLKQNNWTAVVHPDDIATITTSWNQAQKKGKIFEAQYRLKRFDGTYHWQLGRSVPIKDKDGTITRWFGTATDIDERKKIEEALQQSETRFKILANFAPVGIFETDPNGNCLFVNKRWCTIAGITPEQAYGKGWVKALHPDDKERVFQEWYEAAKKHKEFVSKYRFKSPHGKVTWLQGYGIAIESQGKVAGHIGTIVDITEQKLANEKLQYVETITKHIADAVISTNNDYIITSWNKGAEKIYGWIEKDVLGKPAIKILPTEFPNNPEGRKEWQEALVNNGLWHGEIIQKRKDGTKISILASVASIKDEAGNVIGGVAINRDITEKKRAEEKDRYHANLMKSLSEAVFSTDTKTNILSWNAVAENYFGWTEKEALGKRLTDLVHVTFSNISQEEAVKELMEKGTWSGETIYESRKTGKIIPVINTASVVRDAQGNHIGFLTTVVDISELKNAIALRDDFISVASHELKTPVTSLKMYVQASKKQSVNKGVDTRILDRMETQVNKLTLLIDDLLNISRFQSGKLEYHDEAFDLHTLVDEVVENMQSTTSKHIITIDGTLKKNVYADKDRIGQVLANLLTNAIKYSPNADKIIIKFIPHKKSVKITVQDFGIGIDNKHLSKLFDRFYRVSGMEEKTFPGLGLGLYISNEIIKRYGGEMAVVSQKGKGSEFSFNLPYSR